MKSDTSNKLYAGIAPGFVNVQKCEAILIPPYSAHWFATKHETDTYEAKMRNALSMTKLLLAQCGDTGVSTLQEMLVDPVPGKLFTGVLRLSGRRRVGEQIETKVILPSDERKVFLRYRQTHFISDTHWMEIAKPNFDFSVIGLVRSVENDAVLLYPLIIGWETFTDAKNEQLGFSRSRLECISMRDFCISAEAIHEFSECSNVLRAPPRDWMTYMQSTAEETIKTKFCKLLDVTPPKDWGGEDSDLMCSVHVGSLELSAAILLKGPAGGKRFNPMK